MKSNTISAGFFFFFIFTSDLYATLSCAHCAMLCYAPIQRCWVPVTEQRGAIELGIPFPTLVPKLVSGPDGGTLAVSPDTMVQSFIQQVLKCL